MQFSGTTFLLEIVNFLVLLWILKRFLYGPVLAVVARRREEIAQSLATAERTLQEAAVMREQVERRLADGQRERERAHAALEEELRAERERKLAELRKLLEQEREKSQVLEARRLRELSRQTETAAILQGGQFAGRLLARLAGPDLETRLMDLLLADLLAFPAERRGAIADACTRTGGRAQVTSAFPLSDTRRATVANALQVVVGRLPTCEWHVDPQLLSGLRIAIGPWVLHANLQDELRFFAEAANGVEHSDEHADHA